MAISLNSQAQAYEAKQFAEKARARLTPKKRTFVDEYRLCRNKTEAARRAGYAESDIAKTVQRLSKDPCVREALARLDEHARLRSHALEDRILDELGAIAFLDPRDVLKDDFSVRELDEMPEAARRAIRKIKFTTTMKGRGEDAEPVQNVEVEFYDKLGATDKLAKHIGFYKSDEAPREADDAIAAITKRLKEAAEVAYPIPGASVPLEMEARDVTPTDSTDAAYEDDDDEVEP